MSGGQFTAALAACLLWPGLAIAAIAPGPDAFGYTVASTTNFSFLQITSGGTRVLRLVDDAAATNINIGFMFNFYGSDYTAVSVNVNGLMTFGGASIAWSNVDLTTTAPTDNLPGIAVLWDDWQTLPVGTDGVYYQTTGTAGSRQFIVQWNKLEAVNGDGTNKVIFEARLFEGSNRILFSYFDTAISDETTSPPDAASSGVGATVGIRDICGQTSNRNLQWSYNQAVITNGLNLLFAPPNRPPRIASIARQSNGSILIFFQGKPGSNYVMEGSADFLSWSNLGNLSEGNPGVFQFVDTGTIGVEKRFYRVLAP